MACRQASRSGWMPNSAGMIGKTAAPSGTSCGRDSSPAISTSGDGGDDAQFVAVLERRLQVVEVADVLVVEVDVDEAAHLAVLEQPAGDAGVLGAEVVEHLPDAGALDLDDRLVFGVLPHRGGDMDSDRHCFSCQIV